MMTYQLSEFQYANLVRSANSSTIVFAALEPSDSDSAEQREKYERQLREMDDLIHLGLVKDVSEKFHDSIELSRMNNKRGYRVLALTEHALDMFHESDKRLVN